MSITAGYVTSDEYGHRANIVHNDGNEYWRYFETRLAAESWVETVLEDGEVQEER